MMIEYQVVHYCDLHEEFKLSYAHYVSLEEAGEHIDDPRELVLCTARKRIKD